MEFKTAKRVKLVDANGNTWYQDGIVNADNEKEQFNTVGKGYKIVQHEDVVNKVNEALADKNLDPKVRFDSVNNGARIRMELTFDDISLDIEDNGKPVKLRCYYDNSYNGTTGLRLEIGAKNPYSNSFLWFGKSYYHRHTKGVDVTDLEKKLEKGITLYQDKIKAHFKGMFTTPLTNDSATSFLDNAINDEKYKGSSIHLEAIKEQLKKSTIKNKWQFYCLICDVIDNFVDKKGNKISMENKDRQLSLVIPRLHKMIKNTDQPATKSERIEHFSQGDQLQQV